MDGYDSQREAEEFTRSFARLMVGHLERHALTLSKGEFGLLMALSESDGPMTSTALSEDLHISMSGVANLLRKLERKGFVHRAPRETDRRVNDITITPLGRQRLSERFEQVKRSASLFIQNLPLCDVHEFNKTLKRILAISRKIDLPE